MPVQYLYCWYSIHHSNHCICRRPVAWDPFYKYRVIAITACISNSITLLCGVITHPCPQFSGGSVRLTMTSSNGNISASLAFLCRNFTGHLWIPHTKASDAELWCFLWSAPEPTVGQTMEKPVIWDAIALTMTSLQWLPLNELLHAGNYIPLFHIDVITYPCPNLCAGQANRPHYAIHVFVAPCFVMFVVTI